MSKARFAITLALVTLSVFTIEKSDFGTTSGQNNKSIIRRLTLTKEPVEISYEFNGQSLQANEMVHVEDLTRTREFSGDSDWLKNLTLKLRNTSGKTITYLQIDLSFPEIARDGRTVLKQVFLGVDPDRKFLRTELHMAANETIKIPLAEQYDDIKALALAGSFPVENLSKLWVDLHAALFEDGTLFEAGSLFKRNPDPNALDKWIKVDNL